MIIIQNTPKADVLASIDKEINHVNGLFNTLTLINDMDAESKKAVDGYISRNAVLKGIENELRRSLSPRATLLGSVEDALNTLKVWLPKLRERILRGQTKIYDAETITFKEKGVLDAISSVNFYTRYATMVLDIVLTQANKEERLESYLNKVDFRFFNDTAKYFSNLTTRFGDSATNLDTMIEKLSDEVYDKTSEEIIKAQLGVDAVSVSHGLAPHELNPFHWYKWMKMKSDVSSIQTAHEDIDMLAMKIARLNNRRNGQEDPALERQIEVYQNDIIKKRAKIMEIESRYKGAR